MTEPSRNNQSIESFIRSNKDLFEKSFGQIVADIILNPIVLIIFALVVVSGVFMDSLKTFWWQNLAVVPMVTLMAISPFIRNISPLKAKQHYIANLVLFFHFGHYVFCLYAHSTAGNLAEVPGSMLSIVVITWFFISSSQSRVISIL